VLTVAGNVGYVTGRGTMGMVSGGLGGGNKDNEGVAQALMTLVPQIKGQRKITLSPGVVKPETKAN